MSDHHTRQTLDALADLYLTGPIVPKGSEVSDEVSSEGVVDGGGVNGGGVNGGGGETGEALVESNEEPSAEIAGVIESELESDGDVEGDVSSREVADDVVEGFRPRLAQSGYEESVVEGVLLGNLPGYASPWVSQYAQECSKRYGPAVVVRFINGAVELELFDDRQANEALEVVESDGLRLVLENLSTQVGAWLVVVDRPMHEQRPCLDDLGHWVILTGADEMAVAGADRLIQTLLEDLQGGMSSKKMLGVMAMGCDEDAGASVVERLNAGLGELLGNPIEGLGCCSKMRPVNRRFVGRFECEAELHPWSVFRDFFAELEWVGDEAKVLGGVDFDAGGEEPIHVMGTVMEGLDDSAMTVTAEEMAALNEPVDEVDDLATRDESEAMGLMSEMNDEGAEVPGASGVELNIVAEIDTVKLPDRRVVEHVYRSIEAPVGRGGEVASEGMTTGDGVVESSSERGDKRAWPVSSGVVSPTSEVKSSSGYKAASPVAPVVLEEKVMPELETMQEVESSVGDLAGTPGDLSSFVESLVGVEARCPRQDDAQIAVGTDGGLHLLLFGEDESADTSIRRLAEVRAWAGEHAELLRLACRERAVDVSIEPEAHLFASKPRSAADLAYAGSPTRRPLRLHLLKEVTVGSVTVWVHEPLN